MSELQQDFDQAQADVKALTMRPSNDDLRLLYGYYKQATAGDARASGVKKPGRLDVIGRAKYDAWHGLRSTPADAAMTGYVEIARRLANS